MAKKAENVKFYCPDYSDVSFDVVPSMTIQQGQKFIIQHGKTVKFSNHYLETDDPEVIEHIRKHIWYKIKVFEEEKAGE